MKTCIYNENISLKIKFITLNDTNQSMVKKIPVLLIQPSPSYKICQILKWVNTLCFYQYSCLINFQTKELEKIPQLKHAILYLFLSNTRNFHQLLKSGSVDIFCYTKNSSRKWPKILLEVGFTDHSTLWRYNYETR